MGYRNLIFPAETRFLVTGGAGFIGSNLCETILKMGYRGYAPEYDFKRGLEGD